MKTIKALVVDDSAVVRQVVGDMLRADGGIEVLPPAADPIFAMERMRHAWPDVIVLDVEMPRMDGLTFLRRIMSERPTPVVICSTLTEKGARTTMEALAAGAAAVLAKPKIALRQSLEEVADQFVATVKTAARVDAARLAPRRVAAAVAARASAIAHPGTPGVASRRLVALGTSTGGTQALEAVLTALPPRAPGIVIVQHMPEKFTAAFAARLDELCAIEVREARDNDAVAPGLALIAPGGRHMRVRRAGPGFRVDVFDGPLVNRHRPSVDVLFRSVAAHAGRNALGVIMTGMGDDGANGLLEMRKAGADTAAQDEESCVVYGMPNEAVKRGAAARTVRLDAIAMEIMRSPG